MKATQATSRVGTLPAHRDPNAVRWVAGHLSALIGDQLWFIALGWAAVQSGSPGQVGLVLAAGALPRAILLILGGVLADRWGPRRTAIGSDLMRTLLLLAAAASALLLAPSVLVLIALAGAFGVVDAVFLPATGAMPQQLVAPPEMTRLQGMRSTAQRVATTVGAPLGGLVVASLGVGVGFVAAACATSASLCALVFTRVRPAERLPRNTIASEVRTGLVYVARHSVLLPLLAVAAVFEFGVSGAINVGLPILAHDRGWGASGVGVLLGAFGVGATFTALGLIAVRRVPHVGRSLAPITLVMSTGVAAMSLVGSLVTAAAFALMVGTGAGLAGSLFGSLLLTESSEFMVARVSAIATLASLGLSPVSYALTGLVASLYGASAPFLTGSAISTLAAAIAVVSTALRRAEFPEVDAEVATP